jgi:hypothetical protein
MSSQTDLDQGGTFRQYQRVWMGPSVGYQTFPFQAILNITAAGTYTVARGTNLIKISANGNVTLNLPSAKAATQGPQAKPGEWIIAPVTIVDIGGNAASNTFSIVPNGTEKISNLSSVQLAANYGTVVLEPLLDTGGWNLIQ